MSTTFNYQNKTVFVVGGTSGINLGIAKGFAQAGARLAVFSRDQEKVDAAVIELQESGAEAVGYSADVRDFQQIQNALQQAHQQLGDIDVLVSGAAGNFPAAGKAMSSAAFKVVVDIDLNGTFHVLRAAYELLRKPGAAVINISAPQAFLPMQMQAHVCAAKAGVDMVTRTLAMEWGPDGVRVNSLVPGPIAGTEGMKRLAPTPEIQQAVTQSVPLKRQGSCEDMANAALFIASQQASYISGAVLPVDGGWSLGGASVMGEGLAKMMKAQ
ncbi:SDR family oxidoreductase [Porticoccus sp. GXU_MW_L64]